VISAPKCGALQYGAAELHQLPGVLSRKQPTTFPLCALAFNAREQRAVLQGRALNQVKLCANVTPMTFGFVGRTVTSMNTRNGGRQEK
jgi:hypothetical protein